MRILFVCMAESIHSARWVGQIVDQGWDVRLFPVYRQKLHQAFKKVTYYSSLLHRSKNIDPSVRYSFRSSPYFRLDAFNSNFPYFPNVQFRERALVKVIKRFKPDIIHSLEIQHAGYLTLSIRGKFGKQFPAWIVTNWGSDIYLFGRLKKHIERIKSVLARCDYYSAECQRDINLAREMGYHGKVLPVFPNGGGFDLERVRKLRQEGPTSERRLILLKGYQSWAGRALVGLRALALCAQELEGYRVAIYAASPEVEIAAELFAQDNHIPTEIIPACEHEYMLHLYGQARLYIGLSISDGISTSLLEAMVMGAFPIQSCTACADEWIVDGKSGFVVPPEDPEVIAKAILRALSDDRLVDRAAEINAQVTEERLDQRLIQPQVVEIYQKIYAERLLKKG